MTKRWNSQPASLDNGDLQLRPRQFLKLAVVIGFMIAVALIALYYRNFLIILIIIAVWISWTTKVKRPTVAHAGRLRCAILGETAVGFSTRFCPVSPFKFPSRYCSLHIHGLNKSFWFWMIYLLATCPRNTWKGQDIVWVTSKLYDKGQVGRTRKHWITMEVWRRLRNEALFLLQIDDKLRYYTFIYSF